MKLAKQALSMLLAAILITSATSIFASAYPDQLYTENSQNGGSDMAPLNSEIEKRFPFGVPEELTNAQIDCILQGNGLKVTIDGIETVFNPEAYYAQSMIRASGTTNWTEPLNKDWDWWPEYCQCNYNCHNGRSYEIKRVFTQFSIGNQDPDVDADDLRGYAECYMKEPGYTVASARSSTISYFPGMKRYIKATYDGCKDHFPEYVRYKYANTRKTYSKDVKVTNSI